MGWTAVAAVVFIPVAERRQASCGTLRLCPRETGLLGGDRPSRESIGILSSGCLSGLIRLDFSRFRAPSDEILTPARSWLRELPELFSLRTIPCVRQCRAERARGV